MEPHLWEVHRPPVEEEELALARRPPRARGCGRHEPRHSNAVLLQLSAEGHQRGHGFGAENGHQVVPERRLAARGAALGVHHRAARGAPALVRRDDAYALRHERVSLQEPQELPILALDVSEEIFVPHGERFEEVLQCHGGAHGASGAGGGGYAALAVVFDARAGLPGSFLHLCAGDDADVAQSAEGAEGLSAEAEGGEGGEIGELGNLGK